MKSCYSIRRLRRFLFCAAAPHLGLAELALKRGNVLTKWISYTFGIFVMTKFVPFLSYLTLLALLLWQNLSHFCHILYFLSFCYDKICPIFVTSAKIVTNFMYNYSFLCIKLYIYAYFDILSHFCPIFCHMGQILPLFWHPRNPVIPRVFTFGQKFVTFFQILSPVCHVFVTSINRVVMRFIHKIYINVTNIYKSLTKFF